MGNQSASRLEGDRYQHLYNWFELLQLLPENSPYSHAIIEHPEAGAADDVTLFPHAGATASAQFTQVKWHVDHSQLYDFDKLVEVDRNAKTSVLEKLHVSYRKLASLGKLELCLLSNWGPHPDFGAHLDARTESLAPDFFTSNTRAAKAARERWCAALKIDVRELEIFCQALRFRFGFGSLKELESRVDERMAWHGLLVGETPRHIVTDAVSKWIELGGGAKEINRSTLIAVIDQLSLRAPVANEPKVSLHVHGWVRSASYGKPTIEIDWTPHFDRAARRVGDPHHWKNVLLPELSAAAARFRAMADGHFVDVKTKAPLTANLAVGATLSEAAGFVLKADQIRGGKPQRWSTLAQPTDAHFVVSRQEGVPGPRLLVGIEVSAPIWPELAAFAASATPAFDAICSLSPTAGPGEFAVRHEGDAVALAQSAKRVIRQLRASMTAREVHLVLCCPAALALFIGHRLNAVGRVFSYERTIDGGYSLALELNTG